MILRYAANLKLAKELYTASMYSVYQKAQLN